MNIRSKLCTASAVHHWTFQRITALLLLPFTLWLFQLFQLVYQASYADTFAWLASGFNNLMISLWLLTVCWHADLGVQVVLEDYVADKSIRQPLMLLSKIWFGLIALSGLVSLQIIFWHGGL